MATAQQITSATQIIRQIWSRPGSINTKIFTMSSLLWSIGITIEAEQIQVLTGAGVPITFHAQIQARANSTLDSLATGLSPSTAMKVYTPFGVDDIVSNMSRRVTAGMWTGNTGSLETFFTSSAQSGSTGDWYWNVYNANPATDSTAEKQFAVAYGHRLGYGYPLIAVVNTSKEATKAIYAQYANLLLDPEDTQFTFANDWDTDHILVINLQRNRLKQKMDAGNWELTLVSGVNTLKLIDDSALKFDQSVSAAGRKYNVVSGSLNVGSTATIKTAAASEPSGGLGLFYPDRGFIVLNPDALKAYLGAAFVNSGSAASAVISKNSQTLIEAMKQGASFTARNEEIVTSTHYFTRIKNRDYNLSNNPTYYTSSDGSIKNSTFIGDPHSYITTVGLYNDSNELLAVAKVSTPLLKSFDREALIKVKLDY